MEKAAAASSSSSEANRTKKKKWEKWCITLEVMQKWCAALEGGAEFQDRMSFGPEGPMKWCAW